jgi:hypothetical protein
MTDSDNTSFFPADALASLHTPGIGTRWAAVQEHLHPRLVLLAELIQARAAQQFPRQWSLYETSFKSQRYVHRGPGERAPIDEYHVAFDRPPRGAGILVSVSGAEQAVLVGLQLWRARKQHLHQLWESDRALWLPLVERIEATGQARFTARARARGGAEASQTSHSGKTWLDRYLAARQAGYLWAGFVYPWNSLSETTAEQIVADVLALFSLNEALMEQAEALEAHGAALLREQRAVFAVQTPTPSIDTIIERMRQQGFALNETMTRAYHVALQTRPLVILTGISGTGKTRLTRLYADAVHYEHPPAENPFYLLVAVQPDWHNARDMLGYYNAITGRYHPTPFLRFLLRAAANPQQAHFVCLDEMNLARPEYYLAPLLSALETVDRTIDLGAPADEVQTVTGELLPNRLRLPLNVHITGTVNVDESTYALSDKLLDRANVIELTEVDLAAFRATYQGSVSEDVWRLITAIHASVARAGKPFGYRTLEQMLHYLEQASAILSPQQALDLQIKQKVLPRLRGEDSPRLRRALTELLALLSGAEDAASASLFPESAEKVRAMLERLDLEGFTDFYS